MTLRPILSATVFALALCPAMAQSSSSISIVSADDVYAMMKSVKFPEANPRRVYEPGPCARPLAAAIAAAARTREEAASAAVFAAYESGEVCTAVGDGGKAHGAYQLRYVAPELAENPDASTRIWLSLARHSMDKCGDLTQVMSGHCAKPGEKTLAAKSVRRAEMIRSVQGGERN